MTVSVKICGLTDAASMAHAIASGAALVGLVYYPASPRHVSIEQAAALRTHATVPVVSVLVDPDDALLREVVTHIQPDYIQLHGKETPARVQAIRALIGAVRIIKAVPIRSGDDVAAANAYAPLVDRLLFDAKPPELPGMLPGGNGLAFDWALLKGRHFTVPWILSGGLNAANVADAITQSGADMVDVSSGVEKSPGVKESQLMEQFIKAAHSL